MAEKLDRINPQGNSWNTIFTVHSEVGSPHIYQLKWPLEKVFLIWDKVI